MSSSSVDELLRRAAADFPAGADKLRLVQQILESNKILIAEIGRNHDLRTPESLQRNSELILELNSSIGGLHRAFTICCMPCIVCVFL